MNWKIKLLYLLTVGLMGHSLGWVDLQLGLAFMATWILLRLYLIVVVFRSFVEIDYTNRSFTWVAEIQTWRDLLDKLFLWSIYTDLGATFAVFFCLVVRVWW